MTATELEAFFAASGNAYRTSPVDGGTAITFRDRGCPFTLFLADDDPSFLQIVAHFDVPEGVDATRLAAIVNDIEQHARVVKLQTTTAADRRFVVVSAEQFESDAGFAAVFWHTVDTVRTTGEVLVARLAEPPPAQPVDLAHRTELLEAALMAAASGPSTETPTADDRVRQSLALLMNADGSSGTAFCLAVAGDVALFVTNAHVVGDATTVTLYQQFPVYRKLAGNVVVRGTRDTIDLAFVAAPAGGVPAVELATQPPARDAPVALLGYARVQLWAGEQFGELVPSIHLGTVTHVTHAGTILHDASSRPGNSGGPLFDPATGIVLGVQKGGWETEEEAIAICATVVAAFFAEHRDAVVPAQGVAAG